MRRSKKNSINIWDFAKGLILACVTDGLFVLQESIRSKQLTFNWEELIPVFTCTCLAYLGKKFKDSDSVGLHPDKPSLN